MSLRITPAYSVLAPAAGIARVQTARISSVAGTVSTVSIVFGASWSIGNLLVCALALRSGAAVGVRATAGGVAMLQSRSVFDSTGSITARLYYWKANTSDTTIVLTTDSAATVTSMAAGAAEYSGANISSDDVSAGTVSGTGTSPATGAVTNVSLNALFVGAIAQAQQQSTENTSWASSPTNSFSIATQITSKLNTAGNDSAIALVDRVVTSVQSAITCAVTGPSGRYGGILAALREVPEVGVGFSALE